MYCPNPAIKLHTVEFLRQRLGLGHNAVTFAGDSGNYAAGILEGLVHYNPELGPRFEAP